MHPAHPSQPVETKASPSLPPLVILLTTPLSQTSLLPQTFPQFLTHIITIPLLLNRLPLTAVTTLSARLPLNSLHLVIPSISSMISDPALAEPEPKVHMIANLVVLTPPRYSKLPAKALEAYLELMAALMNALPAHALEPPERNTRDLTRAWTNGDGMDADESDEEDGPAPHATVVTSFEPPPRLPELDKRTRTRLQTLPSSQHLNGLFGAAQHHASRESLIAFCFALTTVWPTRKDKILATVVAFNGGGLLRETYRQYVRSSPLGREDTLNSLTSTSFSSYRAHSIPDHPQARSMLLPGRRSCSSLSCTLKRCSRWATTSSSTSLGLRLTAIHSRWTSSRPSHVRCSTLRSHCTGGKTFGVGTGAETAYRACSR